MERSDISEEKIKLLEKNNQQISSLLEQNEKLLQEMKSSSWDWITVTSASQKLGVCVATIYNLAKSGKLQSKRIGNKMYVCLQGGA